VKFDVITLFPELFSSFLSTSLLGKAIDSGKVAVSFVDPRDFSSDRHRRVDDTPSGGGDGMVLKPEPVVAALESLDPTPPAYRILLCPQGEKLTQGILEDLKGKERLALVCGRYEGFDERIRTYVDREISLGDFVLNGGEVAAMALIDGISRLVPGVIGNEGSLADESHGAGLLEYPQYTRPREFRGESVPEVLLNGNHAEIARWRKREMLERTRSKRPDLWREYRVTAEDAQLLGEKGKTASLLEKAERTYVALVHHPVYDREKKIVTTAVTNLDLHDIARSSRTYGLAGYFVVTPLESQQELVTRILSHWTDGHGARYHHQRREALQRLQVQGDLQAVIAEVTLRHGIAPTLVTTSAQQVPGRPTITAENLRDHELVKEKPVVIVMGTGWGLADEVQQQADLVLPPIQGPAEYNHLSVRSATAILLDRIFAMGE
jgi:tRNA (guanine37-N1)-methyltransferase